MPFFKPSKNKEDKNTISKTKHTYKEEITKRYSVQSTTSYTRSTSTSDTSAINLSGSLPQLSLNLSALSLRSNPSDSRWSTDARPLYNTNNQGFSRNSPGYRSLQIPSSTISNNYGTTGTGKSYPKSTLSSTVSIPTSTTTGSGSSYSRPVPSITVSFPTNNESSKPPPSPTVSTSTNNEPSGKIVVKKTGRFYDGDGSIIPTYSTSSKKRGKVLIINNIMFKDNKAYRRGAEVDDVKLKDLFEQMGFKVQVKLDLKKLDMITEVRKFSQKKSLKKVDIAVVVIMSHGTKNEKLGGTEIFGMDDGGVLVDDLIKFFNENDCESMRDKPKIFIFQCCRGDNEQFLRIQNDAVPFKPYTEDVVTNTLIAYSSLPGFVSHRDPERGTWYISTLCEVFSEHAHEHHVEDLLKIVNQKMGDFDRNVKQSTHYENRGFQRCYLHPV